MARNHQIQVRKGTATQWSTTNPILVSGEPGFDTTNNLLKIGDGTSTWSSLSSNVGVGDAGLLSIAGLTTAADTYIYTSANDVYTTGTITTFGRSLVDDADAATSRTTLGLAIGTNVQAYDAGLATIAGLTTEADRYLYTVAHDLYVTGTITTFGRSLVDDADASTARTTLELVIGTNVQAYDAGLQSIAGLATTSGSYLYTTANDVYTTGTSTVYGRSVLAASGVESLVTTTLTAGTGIALSYNSGTDTVTINTTYSTSRGSETVTSNKSAFTVASEYVSGNLDVYYNGLKFLRNDDFTETSSTVFTLTNPAVSGDVVEWVGLVGPATYQISDAGLTSIAGLTTAADTYIYTTANDVYTTGTITTFGRSLVDDSTAAAARSTLEIGKVASTLAGGRLTLQTAVGVPASDQTAKTTIYYTPFAHGMIGLYDGTNWIPREFTERSLALGTLVSGKNYDVFAVSISDVISIEALVWTSDSARATALIAVDGVLCKTGDTTRRYVGTFRTTATTTTEDSEAKRFVYNVNNQVQRAMLGTLGYANDNAVATFTFLSLNVFAPLNGGTGNKCEWINGLTETVFLSGATLYSAGAGSYVMVGVGIDTTTSASWIVAQNDTAGGACFEKSNNKSVQFAAGYHFSSLNGVVVAANVSATIYRDDSRYGGTVDPLRTFISGSINS